MIRFALIAASTLGFFLTAALGNLMVPLLRAFQGRWDEPKARQAPSPKQEAPDAEPERPPQAPTMGGLCLMVGVLAAVGVGWTAACVAQPELLGAESLFSVRLLTALLGALLFGGVGLLEDLARIRNRSVLGLRRYTRLGLEAAAGAVVLVLLGAKGCLAAGITLPGVGYIDLGIAAPLLWEGLLVALAECARIADGMDGIVCGHAGPDGGDDPAGLVPAGRSARRAGRFPDGIPALELPARKAAAGQRGQPVSGRDAGVRAPVHRLA